ncbi:hypothetical protein ZOSMA_43G00660 [Zostera marina]|uniref:Uncharacterized protein n=1 Tax=Zostera marina TaxID=29655 RepID=A0A0K9P1M4_ZOSMR|nr:hypothetical protein ZOSMA_43G00660 [Zostera marina]
MLNEDDPKQCVNDNSEQLNDKKNNNNVRQNEVNVEEENIVDVVAVQEDNQKIAEEFENTSEKEDKDDKEGDNDKMNMNFTPPSFNLNLFDSSTPKVNSETEKETITIPSYVVKGKGATDYPKMKKVKEELYEAWGLKIKDNANKTDASTSNQVDLTLEDNCNPKTNKPKNPIETKTYAKDNPDFGKTPTFLSSQEDSAFLDEACVMTDKAEKAKIFLKKLKDLNKGDNILKMRKNFETREREAKTKLYGQTD